MPSLLVPVLVGVLLATGTAACSSDPDSGRTVGPPVASPAPDPAAPSSTPGSEGSTAGSVPGSGTGSGGAPSDTVATGTTAPTTDPGTDGAFSTDSETLEEGQEGQEGQPGQSGLPGLGAMAQRARRPLVTTPLPRAASASGTLVAGFPAFLRLSGAGEVESSSLSPSGSRLQVALVGTTPRGTASVLLAYRTRLTSWGMDERRVATSGTGSETAAFGRGRSTVTVTAVREGDRTTYSVFGVLHAGGG